MDVQQNVYQTLYSERQKHHRTTEGYSHRSRVCASHRRWDGFWCLPRIERSTRLGWMNHECVATTVWIHSPRYFRRPPVNRMPSYIIHGAFNWQGFFDPRFAYFYQPRAAIHNDSNRGTGVCVCGWVFSQYHLSVKFEMKASVLCLRMFRIEI